MKLLNFIKQLIFASLFAVALTLIAGRAGLPIGFQFFSVITGSMESAIPVGSIVITKRGSSNIISPVEIYHYRIGDVITFALQDKTVVTHRITEQINNGGLIQYRTKGDANETADDQLVKESKIIGKVVWSVPLVGFLINFAKQPAGYLLFVVVPAMYVIVSEAVVISREIKQASFFQKFFGRKNGQVPQTVDIPNLPSQTLFATVVVENTSLSHVGKTLLVKILLPMLIGFVVSFYFVSVTLAYFSDTGQSSDNIFSASSVF